MRIKKRVQHLKQVPGVRIRWGGKGNKWKGSIQQREGVVRTRGGGGRKGGHNYRFELNGGGVLEGR